MTNIELFRSMQEVSEALPHDSSARGRHYERMDRVWDLLTEEEKMLIHEESLVWAKSKGII